jgi:hypothetical protein
MKRKNDLRIADFLVHMEQAIVQQQLVQLKRTG